MQSDNSTSRRLGRPKVDRPLCPVCGINPLKRARDTYCGKACSNAARAVPPLDRFLACETVIRKDLPSLMGLPCIDWTKSFSGDGYPAFSLSHETQVGAHRYAFTLAHAKATGQTVDDVLASGVHVAHVCDRPPCIQNGGEAGVYVIRDRTFPRYGHLVGTDNAGNTHDKVDKGRARYAHGEDHYAARLTPEIVQQMDRMYASGMLQREIAEHFGISQGKVSEVLSRRKWKHVPRAED